MSVVYVADQGASIAKRGERLCVYRSSQLLRWFHTKDIRQLILVGNIAMTSQALTFLLKHGIDTVFLTYYGKYKGRLVGEFGKNVNLRIAQFRYLESPANRAALAARYVEGKIANQLTHLEKRSRRVSDERIKQAILKNHAILAKLRGSPGELEILRGFEGIAAKNYFSAFPAIIANPDFLFSGRNKRPPKDEINALLSLGYTFLLNQIMTATYVSGLDPYYGALHDIAYGRQSLVLDMMEEYRPLVDNMVISLVNRREIRLDHFSYNVLLDTESDSDADDGPLLPVSMTQEGMKIIITAFARLINSRFHMPDLKQDWMMKDIFQLQARKLAALFVDAQPYESFRWL